MIPVPSGVRIWIATGHADMRKGMPGLSLLVQEHFKRDPFAGDVFIFRGRAGSLIKCLWHDGLPVTPAPKVTLRNSHDFNMLRAAPLAAP